MISTCVITSIAPPTAAVRAWSKKFSNLIIIGDLKSPKKYVCGNARFLSLKQQLKLPFRLPRLLPVNHYSRKNIGYLLAAQESESIFDTDDDNRPLPGWKIRNVHCEARFVCGHGWFNVYRCFVQCQIWPRGFPLEEAMQSRSGVGVRVVAMRSLIQQSLATNDPDVDAVWRLLFGRNIRIEKQQDSVALSHNLWCPFNSQNSWWFPEAYPLLYLPSYCSFRMTDIWRSFVAQRCLWALGSRVVYHAPDVVQYRNTHSLLKDFEDEVPGYLNNARIVEILQNLRLKNGSEYIGENLVMCYEALVAHKFLPKKEMTLVKAYLSDLRNEKGNYSGRRTG